MDDRDHLHLLWTSDSRETAEKMVFMYAINARLNGWWQQVTLIIWGGPAKLVAGDDAMQRLVQEARAAGVHVTACKACANQLGVAAVLEALGVELRFWGEPLTELIRSGAPLLSV